LKILLDASALLPLVTQSGKKLIAEATNADLWTTDLAIYESCNALWKLVTLLKTLTSIEAQNISEVLKELTDKNLIKTTNFTSINLPHTIDIAQKLQLTFYDASYITASQNLKATFVTEDQKLLKAASKYIQTITFSGLQSELAKIQTNPK
jgi:predicted nucleic acid-binding protein